MVRIKLFYKKHKSFIVYFLISCFVALIDIIITKTGEKLLFSLFIKDLSVRVITANAVGISIRFLLQYFLCARKVYNKSNPKVFLIFIATCVLNFFLEEGIVYIFRAWIFQNKDLIWELPIISYNISISFYIAKFFSLAIPFFFIYFLRKYLIGNAAAPENSDNQEI